MTQTKVELIDAKNSVTISGSTPSLTIGDAGAEDTKIVFDGNAQDFYIGLDDSADDLVIGVGSAVGTTPAIHVDENKKVTVGEAGVVSSISGVSVLYEANSIFIGDDVSGTTDTAANSVAVGIDALDAVTTGDANVAIGKSALSGATTGGNNIAIGNQALNAPDTEGSNIAIGSNALGGSIDGGEFNVVIGVAGLTGLTTGDSNVVAGYYAGSAVTEGNNNTFLGQSAGAPGGSNSVTTGSQNICIGKNTGVSATDGSYQFVLGYGISAGEDSQIRIGRASNYVDNEFDTDNAWTRTSDVRKKKNIEDSTLGLGFINELRPVTFEWKPNNEFPKDFAEYSEENHMTLGVTMHGMIAQEVKAALDKAGVNDFGGWKEGDDGSQRIAQEMFVYPLIKAVQELSAEVTTLKQEIKALK